MTCLFLGKRERKKVWKFWIENQVFASWELLSWQRHSEFTFFEQLTVLSSAVISDVCRWVWFLFAIVFYCILLLIPLFYSFLVYVIISVFCLASAMSLYNCLAALIGKIPFGQCRYCTPFSFYRWKVSFGYFLVARRSENISTVWQIVSCMCSVWDC